MSSDEGHVNRDTILARFIMSLIKPDDDRSWADSNWLHLQLTIGALSKDLRSLFFGIYLFCGIKYDFLCQLTSVMKVEVYYLKQDVILQNETPKDFYVLVTGAVGLIRKNNGVEQVVGALTTRDVFGEIGVICNRPQLYTVRTKVRCQVLRLSRAAFLKIIQSSGREGTIIVENLLEKPEMREVLRDVEKMVAELKMDLPLVEKILAECKMDRPLGLCFAATRGDHLLLRQFLKQGMNPNELDSNGKAALHISASFGNEECVRLLLENKADPNIIDSLGFVPLWDALLGNHESVVNLLVREKADLSKGDVKHFARAAIERNNLKFLKSVLFYCGDNNCIRVIDSSMHIAVTQGYTKIVEFLLSGGADIDSPDENGWTLRYLANHLGRDKINSVLKNVKQSDSILRPFSGILRPIEQKVVISYSDRRTPRGNPYNDYLVGVITGANRPNIGDSHRGANTITSITSNQSPQNFVNDNRPRVIISCPEKETCSKLIFLPNSIEELLEFGTQKFNFTPTSVLLGGAQVEDIALIRDGDHLILA